MTAAVLIADVEARGGCILLHGNAIKLTAPAPLPGELVERLRGVKSDIVSYLQKRRLEICGQCAVVVRPDQEYLNVVADGFPGVIHLDCYDAWFDTHVRGRY